jgi:MYND finger
MPSTVMTPLPSKRMGGYDVVLTPFASDEVALDVLGNRTQCTNPSCTNEGKKKCGRCNTVRYCCRECQVEHWRSEHKSLCQRPTAASTFVGKEIPASWLAVNSGGGGVSRGSVSEARLVHDDSRRGKRVEKPAILSQASRASLLSYLEFHSPDTDGSFTICVSGGSGAFISEVPTPPLPSCHGLILETLQFHSRRLPPRNKPPRRRKKSRHSLSK